MFEKTWHVLLGTCCAISTLAVTIGLATLVGKTLDMHINKPNAGQAYFFGILICGISFAKFIAYCTILLAFNWKVPLFRRALQILVLVHVLTAVAATSWFSVQTGRFDAINGIWLLSIISTELLALTISKKFSYHQMS